MAQSQLPPPVDRTGSIEARKKAQAAQAEQVRAQGALTQAVVKLRTDFEAGQDWQNAQAALKQAQAEFDTARKPIIEAVKKRPDYQRAEVEKIKADKELAELRANNVIGDPILKVANKRADASADMSKIEMDALNAEPKVVEARKKLQEATAQVAMLKKQFDASVPGDAGWQEAKKAVDTAQEQVTAANKEVTTALAREADAEKSRQEQIRQSRKRY
ncbi:MAG TPA: hypothetical protein VGQ99_23140 [Tepidisphaeraceae bacterium]|jgi:hypothetical protein|nr:hypothetical protein [Tepidisphaeraceae bacterium]